MSIDKLCVVATVTASDAVALFSASLGADARATLTTILTWLQSELTTNGVFQTQYAAPNASGFSITISPTTTGGNVFLLLTPVAGYAAGTVTFPALASCVDGQEVLVTTTQAVTTLTTAGNGASLSGAPTTLAANAFFRMRYDGVFHTWYRVG